MFKYYNLIAWDLIEFCKFWGQFFNKKLDESYFETRLYSVKSCIDYWFQLMSWESLIPYLNFYLIIYYAESRAIIRYFASKYADRGPDLLGKTLEERALVEQWLEVEASNFNNLCFNIMFQLVILPKMGKPGDLALAHKCEQDIEKVLDVYETRLSQSTYLAGDNFTLADLSHLPGLEHLIEEAKLGHLVTERKNVNAWWEKISSRPAWKKLKDLIH